MRAAAGRAHRAAGLGEPRGRAHRGTPRRADHLDEAVGVAPDGGRAAAAAVDLAASQEGGFIWPAFLPAYDAAATLVHLLDLLASDGRSLSAIVADVPDTHVAHEAVPTPWERKGAVMREMVERAKDHPTVLVDGVKIIYPDGWALVLPDPGARGHARVGRRARATPRRAGWSRSTPVRSPS